MKITTKEESMKFVELFKKSIMAQLILVLLVVHITLAFAQEQVGVTIIKDTVELDLDRIDLYMDQNTEPFDTIPVIDPTLPLKKNVTVTTINGEVTITAVPVDKGGNSPVENFSKPYDLTPEPVQDIIYSKPFTE
jgi:hypothetical protein